MPGLSFLYELNRAIDDMAPAFASAVAPLLHDERYQLTWWSKGGRHYLASTAYPEYPMESFEADDVFIVVEGRFYGWDRDMLARRLRELAEIAFEVGDDGHRRLREWLLGADGDFLVILFHRRTGDVVIVNDVFARLPVYWHRTHDRVIVARELRFVSRLMHRLTFDRMAIAQYLLFGYPLSPRTLLQDVGRLPPATRLRIDGQTCSVHLDALYAHDFGQRRDEVFPPAETAKQLVKLFGEACEARAAPGMAHVVSLSGGFDSRAIAACFEKLGIRFRSVTYLDHAGNAMPDVPVARRLAEVLALDWALFELPPPTARDVLKLLRMKNGMNPLGMSFLLPFLETLQTGSPAPVHFVTGEAGTFVLPDPRPPVALDRVDRLVAYLIRQNHKFPLEAVAALTGLDRAEITDELACHVAAYPEQDCRQKYVHFVTSERAFRWHSEAEDRNRCYFWGSTPFYGLEFFTAAMRCPDDQKADYALYGEFLLQLSPAAAAIPHAGMGAPIASDTFKTASRVAALLREQPEVRRLLERRGGGTPGYDADSTVVRSLRHQLEDCDALDDCLSRSAVRHSVERSVDHTREQLDLLFTITAIVEDLTTGRSVLEQ